MKINSESYLTVYGLIQSVCYILIAEQLSGIHWWYKTASHAAELTAGFYNPCNRDGYAAMAAMLKKHGAALNFSCSELRMLDQQVAFADALADPEGLVWQVRNPLFSLSISFIKSAILSIKKGLLYESLFVCYRKSGETLCCILIQLHCVLHS